ncbi:MAG: glutamyl-tRNA reductase [Parachlamydiaceae bacterium]
MRVGILGVNHKLADLKLRELLAIACKKRLHPHSSLFPYVLLSTCNRTEIYFSSDDLAEAHSFFLSLLKEEISDEFEQKLYAFFGHECFHHLAKVASGVDSAIFAETEIQGQVKTAYDAALSSSKLSFPLHFLFQKSLRISKAIRTAFSFERSSSAFEQTVFSIGSKLFQENPSILFVGASEINGKLLDYLQKRGCNNVTLCNRTKEHGDHFSAKYSVPQIHWNELHRWSEYDWVIFGTKSEQHLVSETCLNIPFSKKKLLIDLSMPRNIDPKVGKDSRIELFNIDQLQSMVTSHLAAFESKRKQAEQMILEKVSKQSEIYLKKGGKSIPLFAA